jgi:tetratricopeptide (TPR) repeat protein
MTTNETKSALDTTYYPPSQYILLRQALEPTVSDETVKLLRSGPIQADSPLPTFLAESLNARSKSLGPTAPQTLDTVQCLANIYSQQNDLANAEIFYRQALAGFLVTGNTRRALGPRYNLGALLNQQGRYVEAVEMLDTALGQLKEVLGEGSQQYVGCLRELMVARAGDGKKQEAERLFEDGRRCIREAHWSDEDKAEHLKTLEDTRAKIGKGN